MKKNIRKWVWRLGLSGLFLVILLITLVLNPSLLYAHKTTIGSYNIYHNTQLDSIVIVRLQDAAEISKQTELYNQALKYDICLDDGSLYPSLIRKLIDDSFGATFYNKIVFWGTISFKDNYGLQEKHKWNLTRDIAHAEVHCLQFHKLGLWKSNPIAGYPSWKWEGYAEYIARKSTSTANLDTNISYMIQSSKQDTDWIQFADGTGSSLKFYKRRMLVQFCTEIKKQNFEELLKDSTNEQVVYKAMMSWYKSGLN